MQKKKKKNSVNFKLDNDIFFFCYENKLSIWETCSQKVVEIALFYCSVTKLFSGY